MLGSSVTGYYNTSSLIELRARYNQFYPQIGGRSIKSRSNEVKAVSQVTFARRIFNDSIIGATFTR